LLTSGAFNETHHDAEFGGDGCFKESSFGFKTAINLILFPHTIFFIYKGVCYIRDSYPLKKAELEKKKRSVWPNLLEVLTGLFALTCYIFQFMNKIRI